MKRRLTQRTILEVHALKKQSKEAIHILIYAAELVFGLKFNWIHCVWIWHFNLVFIFLFNVSLPFLFAFSKWTNLNFEDCHWSEISIAKRSWAVVRIEQRRTGKSSTSPNHWRIDCFDYQRISTSYGAFGQLHWHNRKQSTKVTQISSHFSYPHIHLLSSSYLLKIHSSMRDLLHHFTYAADSLARTAHLDKVKASAIEEAYVIISKVSMLYGFMQLYSSNALVSDRLCYRVVSFRPIILKIDFHLEIFPVGECGLHFGWPRPKQRNSKLCQFIEEKSKTSKCEFSTRQQQSDSSKQCQRNLLNMRHITDILFYSFYF